MNSFIRKRETFLKLPINSSYINKSTKQSNNNFQSIISDVEFNKSEKNINLNINNNKSIINRSTTFRTIIKNENNSTIISNKNNNIFKKNKPLSCSGLIEIKELQKSNKYKKERTPVFEPRKIKKKVEKINKQLYKISKNNQNTSKNVNNPEEFYMNFFNNIISKEAANFNGDKNDNDNIINNNDNENDNISNILNKYAGNKVKNTSLSGKNSNEEISFLDSLASNKESGAKDSDKNITKNKEKR